MDDDEGRVKDLLQQYVDHAALRLSTEPSDALDADLLARLQRLKATPNPPPAILVDTDGLQPDLAERLAALKKGPSKPPLPEIIKEKDPSTPPVPEIIKKKGPSTPPAPEIIKTAKLSNPNTIVKEMHEGDAFEVEKLLESVRDCVRLEKSGAPKSSYDNNSDEDVSDSEVDHIVEWAKDASVLEEDETDDTLDNTLDADLPTTPTAGHSSPRKKKVSRWKFW